MKKSFLVLLAAGFLVVSTDLAFARTIRGQRGPASNATKASIKTTIPSNSGLMEFWGGRNYYYLVAGGPGRTMHVGVTEGSNWGWRFQEFFVNHVGSDGVGSYLGYGGNVPAFNSEVTFNLERIGTGQWKATAVNSDNVTVFDTIMYPGIDYVSTIGNAVASEKKCSTSTIDGSYRYFWNLNYNGGTAVPYVVDWNDGINGHSYNSTGKLENHGTAGFRLTAY